MESKREYKPSRGVTRALNADISERTYNILQWRKWKEQTSLYKLVEEAVERAWGAEYDDAHVPPIDTATRRSSSR